MFIFYEKSFRFFNEARLTSLITVLKDTFRLLDVKPDFLDSDMHTIFLSVIFFLTLQYATTLEKNKLFVRGLPFSSTQEDVEAEFAKVRFYQIVHINVVFIRTTNDFETRLR